MNTFVFSDDVHYWWQQSSTSISMACCDWNFSSNPNDPPFVVYDIITGKPFEIKSAWGLSHGTELHHLSMHLSNIVPAMIKGKHDNLSMRIVTDEFKPEYQWHESLCSVIEKNNHLPTRIPLSGELTYNDEHICAVVTIIDKDLIQIYTCTDFKIKVGMKFDFQCKGLKHETTKITMSVNSIFDLQKEGHFIDWVIDEKNFILV